MKKYVKNIRKIICSKYLGMYGEVRDGPVLSPLYSLWDFDKIPISPRYIDFGTWKKFDLSHLYNMVCSG